VETDLDPHELKAVLRGIEAELGRVRTDDKYAPRPIDLDIALYGQQVFELDGSPIPDPGVLRHPHVAAPLADVAPDWAYPEMTAAAPYGRSQTISVLQQMRSFTC